MTVRLNPTCGHYGPFGFGCNDAFPIVGHLPNNLRDLDDDGNKRTFVRLVENRRTGHIRIDWDLTQSRLPAFRPNLTINGRLDLTPPVRYTSGWFRLRADKFPSNELYYINRRA